MYWIDGDPRSKAPGLLKGQLVTVRAGHFTQVGLFYDIGMR